MEKKKDKKHGGMRQLQSADMLGEINGAKYDEYWQKGRKRLCPDCHKKYIADRETVPGRPSNRGGWKLLK